MQATQVAQEVVSKRLMGPGTGPDGEAHRSSPICAHDHNKKVNGMGPAQDAKETI